MPSSCFVPKRSSVSFFGVAVKAKYEQFVDILRDSISSVSTASVDTSSSS